MIQLTTKSFAEVMKGLSATCSMIDRTRRYFWVISFCFDSFTVSHIVLRSGGIRTRDELAISARLWTGMNHESRVVFSVYPVWMGNMVRVTRTHLVTRILVYSRKPRQPTITRHVHANRDSAPDRGGEKSRAFSQTRATLANKVHAKGFFRSHSVGGERCA